jgi:hypothetical protein
VKGGLRAFIHSPCPPSLDAPLDCMLSEGRQCDGPFPDEEVGPTTLTGAISAKTLRLVVRSHWAWGNRDELSSPILGMRASRR